MDLIPAPLAASYAAANTWYNLAWRRHVGRNGWGFRDQNEFDPTPWFTNDHRGALEQFQFANDLANDRCFAYVRLSEPKYAGPQQCTFTTGTGRVIGTGRARARVYFGRHEYRRSTTMRGIDGRNWHGWYCESTGDYVRLRLSKNQGA